jgi:hypothetical protein
LSGTVLFAGVGVAATVTASGVDVGDGGRVQVDDVFRRYFTDSAPTCDVELWTEEAAVVVCAVASGTATGEVLMRRA